MCALQSCAWPPTVYTHSANPCAHRGACIPYASRIGHIYTAPRSLYRVSVVSRHHIRATSPYIRTSPCSPLPMCGVFAVRHAMPRDAGGLSPTRGGTNCGIARRWQRVSDARHPLCGIARHRQLPADARHHNLRHRTTPAASTQPASLQTAASRDTRSVQTTAAAAHPRPPVATSDAPDPQDPPSGCE